METSPSPYAPPFLSYAQIPSKNGSQSLQKGCHLSFVDGFEFGDFEKRYNRHIIQVKRIRQIIPKNDTK